METRKKVVGGRRPRFIFSERERKQQLGVKIRGKWGQDAEEESDRDGDGGKGGGFPADVEEEVAGEKREGKNTRKYSRRGKEGRKGGKR